MPSASVSEFIVVAVPIVLQKPVEGAEDATSSMKPLAVDFAGREQLARFPHDGARAGALPSCQPLSIGPTDSAIAGMFTVAAAIRQRGHGLVAADGQHDTIERIAVEHLDQAQICEVAVEARAGRLPVSWIGWTANSSAMPPAAQMPSLTCWARTR